jgi:hypothetical protein
MEQRGCWLAPASSSKEGEDEEQKKAAAKHDFASAFLDALDEDLVHAAAAKNSSSVVSSTVKSGAPTSGTFLGLSLGENDAVLNMQLDVRFCVMNGAHAAAGACRALVEYLDSLLASEDALDTRGDRSTALVELAREELCRYAGDFEALLQGQIALAFAEFCGGDRSPRSRLALDRIYHFFTEENFAIDAKAMKVLETEDRLEKELARQFTTSPFLQQISHKCESEVLQLIGTELVEGLTRIVVDALYCSERRITDWGALLFWKEVRLLQGLVGKALTAEHTDHPPVYSWPRLSQIATVLQLESPSEWQLYRSSTSVLSNEELERTMLLRADFSPDAIRTVLAA